MRAAFSVVLIYVVAACTPERDSGEVDGGTGDGITDGGGSGDGSGSDAGGTDDGQTGDGGTGGTGGTGDDGSGDTGTGGTGTGGTETGGGSGSGDDCEEVEDPGPPPATCGDGVLDPLEQCDCGGESCLGHAGLLNYMNCLDFCSPEGTAFEDGVLECTDECGFDVSGCIYCGDGVREGIELCDGNDLGGAQCFDADYLGGGTLACADDCTFDTSGCLGPMCGEHWPAPGGGSCPPACTSCADPVCVITCDQDDQCESTTIQCPDGWDCLVECTASDDACKLATINCPTDGACEVLCEGMDSCEDGHISCGGGLCEVTCEAAQDTCDGLQVTCDRQACSATCDFADPDEMPQLTCGEACECTPC